MNNLQFFQTLPFIQALKQFFKNLNVPVNYFDDKPVTAQDALGDHYTSGNKAHSMIDDVFILGLVDDAAFENEQSNIHSEKAAKKLKEDYDGLVLIGVTLKNLSPSRSALSEITRAFNRSFPHLPVTVIFKYSSFISYANAERLTYIQQWREGDKIGKVTLLKDVSVVNTHTAHLRILDNLIIDPSEIDSFKKLQQYWQTVFSLQTLNNQFYADLQDWFYYASQHIKLPFKQDYVKPEENIKNFLVRLLSRSMFCWFVKEKGLIKPELLELKKWNGERYTLTADNDDKKFLQNNSYYRGVLQNIFFNALNKKEKKSKRDFKWVNYLHPDFKIEWLTNIPYLNGGIFDELLEDNAKESIEDGAIKVPNFLFYGKEEKTKVVRGRGARAVEVIETIEHKGLNGILKSYKFTLEENTPYEEDIALDPEMLGLVFENLLAELDPNLEESTKNSIRKLTGSYYTPRQVIQEMVNESLFLYFKKHIDANDLAKLKALIYQNVQPENGVQFCKAIVKAIDQYKMLDPACGSGAFPMGMLHRLVEILKLTDPSNTLWLQLKLQPVDAAYRNQFEKTLKQHLDDYSRKLGIIRDCIYGIDIQPLAVQITKLRFFISLLIDQKVEKGIIPMPNIETKIICADTLKTLQPDLFASSVIGELETARRKYYQPDLTIEEKNDVTKQIVYLLDNAFPNFSYHITGKKVSGQNKELIKEWFTHATIAAPFFNMDFFYPELKGKGFDCIIGNPPYGGTKISDEVRTNLDIESKDPYGAFIARFLASGQKETPLKHGGVLAFIVSDTFMTIKSHYKLRKQMMDNYIHKMIRVHPDTFRATVNTAIIICERNVFPKKDNLAVYNFNEQHICQMVDMTNISIIENHNKFSELLRKTEGVDFDTEDGILKNISNELYAIYYYPQNLIRTNSNFPFFVANPKLFCLMNDNSNELKTKNIRIKYEETTFRIIPINGREIPIIKLGEIAENLGGVKTYDNSRFVKSSKASGGYEQISPSEIVLSLTNEEKEKGLKDKMKKYVPFDKSGDMITNDGRIINYWKPVEFYLDWSKEAVKFYIDNNGLRNKHRYFQEGITYSVTGVYAPTYRISSGYIFGQKGATIFTDLVSKEYLLAILCSRLNRFIVKNFLSHGVDATDSVIAEIILVLNNAEIKNAEYLVQKLISKLNKREDYNYEVEEQIKIDKLVYEAYGLNAEDIKEVENWYARRYPKLSAAQKVNLRKLGKSDDYLELYGLK